MHSDAMGVVVLSKKKQRKRERERWRAVLKRVQGVTVHYLF